MSAKQRKRAAREAAKEQSGKQGGAAHGKALSILVVAIGFVALGGAYLWHAQARAESEQVAVLRAICEAEVPHYKRAVALRTLGEMDTEDSNRTLEDLAASANAKLAVQTLAAISKADNASARDALIRVLDDGERSDFVRAMAVILLCQNAHARGSTWNEVRAELEQKTAGNEHLEDALACAHVKLWEE